MEHKFFGNYRAIVIQNNDPENNGRVKVWVPHVNATMYNEWNQLASDKVSTDILTAKHVFLGQNVLSNLSTILGRLKDKLPWAEISQPIIGSGSSGIYHSCRSIKNQIDDASQLINENVSNPNAAGEYPTGGIAKVSFGNEELTGIHTKLLTNEALTAQLQSNIKKSASQVDATSKATASKYAQAAGGSNDVAGASVPPIDPTPIQPLKTVANGENIQPLGPNGDPIESDAGGASNQHAFNKAPVRDEFHQQGTPQANNNKANPYTHLFRPPDYHNTARGSFSIPDVGAHVWVFFEGGDPQYPVVWGSMFGAEDYKGIWHTEQQTSSSTSTATHGHEGYGNETNQGTSPDYPNSFQNREVSDTDAKNDVEDNVYRGKWAVVERGGSIEIVSTTEREMVRLAHFSGSYMEFNKLCTSRLATNNDQLLVIKDQFETIHGFKSEHIGKDHDVIIYGDAYTKVGDIRQWKLHSDKIRDILRGVHDVKRLFDKQRTGQSGIDNAPKQTASGTGAPCPICSQGVGFTELATVQPDGLTLTDSLTCGIPGDKWGFHGLGIEPGESTYVSVVGSGGTIGGAPCWCCGGSGLSPSSQDGDWADDSSKQNLAQTIEQAASELLEHERELGRPEHREGGSSVDIVSKNKTVLVGLTFNDFEPYRKDPVGKLVPYGFKVETGGVFPQYTSSPLVEVVHVDDLAGGDYDLTISSKYNVNVGGGGIRFKTTGNILIGGQIMQMFAETFSFGARSEISFDAGKRFDVEADIITFRPRIVDGANGPTQQVAIFGSLNVAQNAIIRGAMHVEGEFTTHHITAPREWHLTEIEPKITQAHIKPNYIIGVCDCGPVTSVCAPNSVEVNPHVHWKADPAWTLVESYEDVRMSAARLNPVGVVAAHPINSVQQFAEQVYPERDRGRFTMGTHFNPEDSPGGDDGAMQPDPDISGIGDGTSQTATIAASERAAKFDEMGETAIQQAKQLIASKTASQFERQVYDNTLIA